MRLDYDTGVQRWAPLPKGEVDRVYLNVSGTWSNRVVLSVADAALFMLLHALANLP